MLALVLTLLACSGSPSEAPPASEEAAEEVAAPGEDAPGEAAQEAAEPEAEPAADPEADPESGADEEPDAEADEEAVAEEEPEPEPAPEAPATTADADAPATATAGADADAAADADAEADEAASSEASPEPEPAPVSARSWVLGPEESRLYVQVYKDPDTAAAGMSHDHVVLARGWSGSVTWHPQDPSQCRIRVVVPVDRLDPDPAWLRKVVGYEGELSEGNRKTIKKNLLARDQLDAESFPRITFESKSCSGTRGAVKVVGDLELRGRTRSITTILAVKLDEGFSASGSFDARATDFGFEPYTAMLGALKNQDRMRFTVELQGR